MLVVRGDSERGAGKDVGRLSRSRVAVAYVGVSSGGFKTIS
jgi:hypothetical protein